MKKILIACGGTGGHLSPGIALAEALQGRGWSCVLLISNKQVDSRLVAKYSQFQYEALAGSAFSANPVRLLRFAVNLVKGVSRCSKLIRQERPAAVVGFGGFMTMPAMLAGRRAGLPTVVHEANRVPGRVTRITSRFIDRLYLPDGVSFVRKVEEDRIRFLGMPVRSEIRSIQKAEAREKLGLSADKRTLLVMGGSQGAQALNQWAANSLAVLAENGVQVFCLTGAGGAESRSVHPSGKGESVSAVFRNFSDDMSMVLSAADLAVSRAGAGSIAEMMRCRLPGVLVPYPFSADDHQVANARNFESLGCGLQLNQDNLSELLSIVLEAMGDPARLEGYRENLRKADERDAALVMARDLEELAG